jgi:hypothetical protein
MIGPVGPSRATTTSSARWAVAGFAVLAVVPLAVVVLVRGLTPVSDWASIELYVRDVGTRATPLWGAWSRYGWNHPGPLLFLLLAIPYRLSGGDPAILRSAAVTIAVGSLVACGWLLRRRSLAALVLGVPLLVLSLGSLPRVSITDYWNPTVAFLPFALVLIAAWSTLDGDRTGFVVLLVAWSFVAQCHLTYGLVTSPALLLAAGLWAWHRHRRRRSGAPPDRLTWWASLAFLVLWVPPLLDTVLHWPGNLGAIVEWSWRSNEPTAGVRTSLRLLGRATALDGAWWRPTPAFVDILDTSRRGFAPGALVVLLLLAGLIAVRRGWRSESRLVAVLTLTWVWALVAVSRATQPLYEWIFRWTHVLAALSWLAVGLVLVRSVGAAVPAGAYRQLRRAGVAVGVVATFVALTAVEVRAGRQPFILHETGATTEQFVDAALAWTPSHTIGLEYSGDPIYAGAVHAGLADGLERHGRAARVGEQFESLLGRSRVLADLTSHDRLLVAAQPDPVATPDGDEELAVSDPLTPAERSELTADMARLSDLFLRADWSDHVGDLSTVFAETALQGAPTEVLREADTIRRVGELRRKGPRLVLYGARAQPASG